jgi:methyl-accepting chemotaxis protein
VQAQASNLVSELEAEKKQHSEELTTTVQRLAGNLNTMMSRTIKAAQYLKFQGDKTTEQIDEQTKKSASKLNRSAQNLHTAAQKATKASSQLNSTLTKVRWTTFVLVSLSSAIIGSALLITLLIFQPDLIKALWTISQAVVTSAN